LSRRGPGRRHIDAETPCIEATTVSKLREEHDNVWDRHSREGGTVRKRGFLVTILMQEEYDMQREYEGCKRSRICKGNTRMQEE
jgi:hypothetical protein